MKVKRMDYRGFTVYLSEQGKDRWQASAYDNEARYDHGVICDCGCYSQVVKESRTYIDDIVNKEFI